MKRRSQLSRWLPALLIVGKAAGLSAQAANLTPEQRVSSAAEQALARLESDRGKLPARLARTPTGTTVEGFDTAQVYRLFESTEQILTFWLAEDEKLAPMVYHVEERFPARPALEIVGTCEGRVCASAASVDQAVDTARGFIARLAPPGRALFVDLDIITDPDGAEAELTASVRLRRVTYTNSTISNLSRGLYDYVIKRQGRAEAKGQLDLVAEAGTRLECKLRAPSDPAGPSFCILKVPATEDNR